MLNMTFEEFEKQASKYSQKAILKAFYNSRFRPENALSDIELYDYEIKTSELLKKSEEVIEKQRKLIGKNDLESLIEYQKLGKQWATIHKKLDKLSDEFRRGAVYE